MLKDDKKLKKMVEQLALYCHEKKYPFVVSIGDLEDKDDNVIACFGSSIEILERIGGFAELFTRKNDAEFLNVLAGYAAGIAEKISQEGGGKRYVN